MLKMIFAVTAVHWLKKGFICVMDGMLYSQLSRPKITVTGRDLRGPGETCDLRDSGAAGSKGGLCGTICSENKAVH